MNWNKPASRGALVFAYLLDVGLAVVAAAAVWLTQRSWLLGVLTALEVAVLLTLLLAGTGRTPGAWITRTVAHRHDNVVTPGLRPALVRGAIMVPLHLTVIGPLLTVAMSSGGRDWIDKVAGLAHSDLRAEPERPPATAMPQPYARLTAPAPSMPTPQPVRRLPPRPAAPTHSPWNNDAARQSRAVGQGMRQGPLPGPMPRPTGPGPNPVGPPTHPAGAQVPAMGPSGRNSGGPSPVPGTIGSTQPGTSTRNPAAGPRRVGRGEVPPGVIPGVNPAASQTAGSGPRMQPPHTAIPSVPEGRQAETTQPGSPPSEPTPQVATADPVSSVPAREEHRVTPTPRRHPVAAPEPGPVAPAADQRRVTPMPEPRGSIPTRQPEPQPRQTSGPLGGGSAGPRFVTPTPAVDAPPAQRGVESHQPGRGRSSQSVPAGLEPTPTAHQGSFPGGAASVVVPRLWILVDTGERHPLTQTTVIGRAPGVTDPAVESSVTMPDPSKSLSRTHLRIGLDGSGGVWVEDTYSANGTTVKAPDGVSLALTRGQRQAIPVGSRLSMGQRWLSIVAEG